MFTSNYQVPNVQLVQLPTTNSQEADAPARWQFGTGFWAFVCLAVGDWTLEVEAGWVS